MVWSTSFSVCNDPSSIFFNAWETLTIFAVSDKVLTNTPINSFPSFYIPSCIFEHYWGSYSIVRTLSFFKGGGGLNFEYLPQKRRGIWKIKKWGGNMVQGQVFLKGRDGGAGTLFLHLEITLPFAKLCYAFEEKLFFSATIIFCKKVILSCLKMILKISHKLR